MTTTVMAPNRRFPYGIAGKHLNGEEQTVEMAFAKANLRWQVDAYPLWADLSEGGHLKEVEVPDHYGIIRSDNNAVLGVVGNRYEIIGNDEVEDILDVVGLPVVAAGSRPNGPQEGRKNFVLFKVEEFSVGGDDFIAYLDAHWSFDGSSPLVVSHRVRRLVCTNGMNRHFASNDLVRIRHTQSASAKMAAAKGVLEGAAEVTQMFMHEVEFMQGTRLTPQEVGGIVTKLVPKPKKESPKTLGRMKAKQEAILDNYFSPMNQPFHGSLWGLIQSINEYEFWQAPVRGGKTPAKRAESQLQRLEMDRFPLVHKALALVGADDKFDAYWSSDGAFV